MATRNFVPRADNEGGIGTALKRWAAGCIVEITSNRVVLSDGAGNYMQLPKLTTTQRDALSAVNGMVIYNTTTLSIQAYENGVWGSMGVGEINTASNVGTAGVGIFKQKTGVDLEFKKINAGSSKITVTDDVGDDEVDIDVVVAEILTASSVTATAIAASAVTTVKIDATAVTAAKIGTSAITTTKIAASAVTTAKINTSTVTTAKIAASAITTTLINATAVTAAKVAPNAVTTTKIAASAVTTAKINATAVTAAKIATSAVTTTKIATSAVTTAKIAASAITTTLINAKAITIAKIADGTDGELITWDTNGNAAVVAVGTAGYVLTSSGVGKAPTFKAPTGGDKVRLWLLPGNCNLPETNPAEVRYVAADGVVPEYQVISYDDGGAEIVTWRVSVSDVPANARVVVYWSPRTTAAATADWDISMEGIGNGEDYKTNAPSTSYTRLSDTASVSTNNMFIVENASVATNCTDDEMMQIAVRMADVDSDGDRDLIGVLIEYTAA